MCMCGTNGDLKTNQFSYLAVLSFFIGHIELAIDIGIAAITELSFEKRKSNGRKNQSKTIRHIKFCDILFEMEYFVY